jgi:hypothetical protein
MLSNIWVWDPGSEIRDPEKTYPGSATLLFLVDFLAFLLFNLCRLGNFYPSIVKGSVADPGCLSRILIFTHPGSRISDPGSKNSNKRER